jgi:hypothetical protein
VIKRRNGCGSTEPIYGLRNCFSITDEDEFRKFLFFSRLHLDNVQPESKRIPGEIQRKGKLKKLFSIVRAIHGMSGYSKEKYQ